MAGPNMSIRIRTRGPCPDADAHIGTYSLIYHTLFGDMMCEKHHRGQTMSFQEPSSGVRVIKPHQFDSNTAQTPGMQRVAAVSRELAGWSASGQELPSLDHTSQAASIIMANSKR